jgi:hypothetical protein
MTLLIFASTYRGQSDISTNPIQFHKEDEA